MPLSSPDSSELRMNGAAGFIFKDQHPSSLALPGEKELFASSWSSAPPSQWLERISKWEDNINTLEQKVRQQVNGVRDKVQENIQAVEDRVSVKIGKVEEKTAYSPGEYGAVARPW